MPPFKAGLLKRKNDSNELKENNTEDKETDSSNEVEDLVKGFLDGEGDATDSEPDEEQPSDAENDEVVFGEIGSSSEDENDISEAESSDLTDSEDDKESEETENEDDNKSDSDEHSNDSGAETGTGLSAAGSSDESIKKSQIIPKKKQTIKKKLVKQKSNKPNSIDVLAAKVQEAKFTTSGYGPKRFS